MISFEILLISFFSGVAVNFSITIAYLLMNCFLLEGKLNKNLFNNTEFLAAEIILLFTCFSPNFLNNISGSKGIILLFVIFSCSIKLFGGKVFPKTTFSILLELFLQDIEQYNLPWKSLPHKIYQLLPFSIS